MGGITDLLMEESHETIYSIHLYNTKMFIDIKPYYWWPMMKLDVAKYVAECLTCARVKTQHLKHYRKLEPLPVPMGRWENITMDYITQLPKTKKGHYMMCVTVDRLMKMRISLQPTRDDLCNKKRSWYTLNDCVRMRQMFHFKILEWITWRDGYKIVFEYKLPSTNRWAKWKNDSNIGGNVAIMYLGLHGLLGQAFTITWIYIQQKLPLNH